MAAERVLAKNSLRAKDAAHDTATVRLPQVLLRDRGAQTETRSLRGHGPIEIERQKNRETIGERKKINIE